MEPIELQYDMMGSRLRKIGDIEVQGDKLGNLSICT
jgi:hypothetical protein